MEDIILSINTAGSEIYGIAYSCPYLLRREGCPFKEIDNFSFKKKVDWIKGLNDEEKEDILDYHLFCSRKRDIKKS